MAWTQHAAMYNRLELFLTRTVHHVRVLVSVYSKRQLIYTSMCECVSVCVCVCVYTAHARERGGGRAGCVILHAV